MDGRTHKCAALLASYVDLVTRFWARFKQDSTNECYAQYERTGTRVTVTRSCCYIDLLCAQLNDVNSFL